MQQYSVEMSGDKEKVAAAIRQHIEGYLRVFPEYFPSGTALVKFISECLRRKGADDEILSASQIQELKDINEYGKKFHHESDEPWEPTDINSGELLGYVNRTLIFTKPPRE